MSPLSEPNFSLISHWVVQRTLTSLSASTRQNDPARTLHKILQENPVISCRILQEFAGILQELSRVLQDYCKRWLSCAPRYTTQPAFISSADSQAGVATAAGEEAKDNSYLELNNFVTNDGGDFIPLVCELFGVWSPFALSTPFIIADYTTVKNGLPQKLAQRQLLQ